jgi:hypothetical protein
MTGCLESDVKSVLESGNKQVQAFFKICEAIDARPVRLAKAPPIHVWISVPHIDSLYREERYRGYRMIASLPASRAALKQRVIEARKKGSRTEVADFMMLNWICTLYGYAQWFEATVKQTSERQTTNKKKALEPNQECIEKWRDYVISDLLATTCPPDSMFSARYGVTKIYENGKCRLKTEKPIPTAPRAWFMEGLKRNVFLEGQWGEIEEGPEPQCFSAPHEAR